MEAVVRPMAWADFPDNARGIFQGFRSEAGEEMVLEKNIFVERVLPGAVIRDHADDLGGIRLALLWLAVLMTDR
jgi:haloalkane dehalogenase